ncbi:malate synthase A [Nocardioides guangzhouensis]|uniref:malate synthase A n=1 Tax=Nocardioides guangzhouensis TaxID=2497878 RepID=UPI001FE5BCF6|nr:malate synthase A [Nocardioides guangzhouensis]
MNTILSDEAVAFVADLERRFGGRRRELLDARRKAGPPRDFPVETAEVRVADWQVAPAPPALRDRRVEITGPTQPKMAVNALNSGARVWLADLEDANTPHWPNVLEGQQVLSDVARHRLEHTSPEGKHYALHDGPLAVPVVRPRGWHLDEKHLPVDGRPMTGALFDFGMHFFHNAAELVERGEGPFYYLPKMQSHLEARLWNDVFTHAQQALGIPHGTVRATVLIETVNAAFEMDEILFELRDHASGLNAGRWDYLFSMIKSFRDAGPEFVLPDRAAVTMTTPFMKAYSDLLVATCHRRGAFAMGGMAAFIPTKDPVTNEAALAKVRADKEREATAGYDGSWVAHPGLVGICAEEFGSVLGDRPNQLDRQVPATVTAADLLDVASAGGAVTEAGVRGNVSVSLRYLLAWLSGNGAAAIDNLMEDAATVEISRSQLWQWIRHGTTTDSGVVVDRHLVEGVLAEEHARLAAALDDAARTRLDQARDLFGRVALAEDYLDFLTVPAYEEYVA